MSVAGSHLTIINCNEFSSTCKTLVMALILASRAVLDLDLEDEVLIDDTVKTY